MHIEVWKDVVGFEGLYRVSSLGVIYSVKKCCFLKSHENGWGYLGLKLYKNSKKYGKCVHVLVAEAFLGKKPDGFDIDHIDNNRKNNKYYNLEYVTRRENSNRGKRSDLNKNKSSKYRGVYFVKGRNKWRAQKMINGKVRFIGEFKNEIEAKEAYERAKNPETDY